MVNSADRSPTGGAVVVVNPHSGGGKVARGKAAGKLLDKEMDASFKALSLESKRPIGMFRAPFGAMSPRYSPLLLSAKLVCSGWAGSRSSWFDANTTRKPPAGRRRDRSAGR